MEVTLKDDVLHFKIDAGTAYSRAVEEADLARFPELFSDEVDLDSMDVSELQVLAGQRGLQVSKKATKKTLIKRIREAEAEE